jgi:hypothetical protein
MAGSPSCFRSAIVLEAIKHATGYWQIATFGFGRLLLQSRG